MERGMMVHNCNYPTTWKVEARGPGIQSHPQLPSKFETSRGYVRPCLKEYALLTLY